VMLPGVLVGLGPLVRGAQSQSNGKGAKTAADNPVELVTQGQQIFRPVCDGEARIQIDNGKVGVK
jgi:hypothetical protein